MIEQILYLAKILQNSTNTKILQKYHCFSIASLSVLNAERNIPMGINKVYIHYFVIYILDLAEIKGFGINTMLGTNTTNLGEILCF